MKIEVVGEIEFEVHDEWLLNPDGRREQIYEYEFTYKGEYEGKLVYVSIDHHLADGYWVYYGRHYYIDSLTQRMLLTMHPYEVIKWCNKRSKYVGRARR